jgi:hypothetical protein
MFRSNATLNVLMMTTCTPQMNMGYSGLDVLRFEAEPGLSSADSTRLLLRGSYLSIERRRFRGGLLEGDRLCESERLGLRLWLGLDRRRRPFL